VHHAHTWGCAFGPRGDNRLVFVILAILLASFILPAPWGWVAIGIGACAEVAETMFWMRLLRRQPVRVGSEALIGASARAISQCRPFGEVRVLGEVWQARCDAGVDAGARVRVRDRVGITLVVEPAAQEPA